LSFRLEAERFIAVAIILGIIVIALMVPPSVVERAWAVQQESTQRWVGHGIDAWAWQQAHAGHQWLAGLMRDAMHNMEDNGINRWLAARAYVILLWAGIVWYRLMIVAVWALFALPIMLAAITDGALVRQVRKASFNTPSPALHKAGAKAAKLSAAILLIWAIVPIDIPALIVPIMVVLAALGVWTWIAHMQKRI
jgi:hypothetical protein